ncbi:carbohydrate-binding protein [Cohnella candidum]|uniref:carbohydrate-binding protein n=1 Tax=Cohnella candidum TaxID=2674991 RepID=UPI0019D2F0B9|nr:carbohydrate-binding protein [Cohnella candidum]
MRKHLAWLSIVAMLAVTFFSTMGSPTVQAAGGPNMAAGKPVTASSYTQTYTAGNVADGNSSTYWESANNAFPQWIQVDLGSAASFDQIVLKLPAGWGSRTQTLSIQGSTDGTNFTNVVGSAGYTFDPASGNTVTINFTAVSTRYVRVNVTANTGWPAGQFSEFEIYGAAVSTPSPIPGKIEAENYSAMNGIQTETTSDSDGGLNVGWIDAGDWMDYSVNVQTAGSYTVEYRVASPNATGQIQLRSGANTLATTTVPNTGGWQTWQTVTATVNLSAGQQTLRIYAGGGGFNINWINFKAGSNPPNGTGTGLSGQYFDNADFTNLKITRTDGTVNFNWANGSPDASMGVDTFSVRWSGKVEPKYSQSYTFYTNTDDGARLWVNNQLIIDKWVDQGTTEWSGTINLTAGQKYDIRLDYYENAGGAAASLSWSSASQPKQIIPQTQLYPSNVTPTPTGGGDVVGNVFAGYQGWFNAGGDGSPMNRWVHWSKNGSAPTANSNVNFELYPDMGEYSKTYATSLANLGNGQPATLFSSYDQETVNKHFLWMQTYNIGGAALQRFGADSTDPAWKSTRDSVAVKVKNAAETYNRKFYVMYDITGMNAGSWVSAIKNDWTNNIVNSMQLTSSSAYAKQNGKTVVCIWGIGFTDRPGTAAEAADLIGWFKNQGIYVIGGVPTYWLDGKNDSKTGFLEIYKSFDMISPWLVGRFGGLDGADSFKTNLLQPDFTFCQQNNIAYQPVLWPGFSWANLNPGSPRNQIPRLHGDFMWRQAYNIKSLGISTGYVAMFDEYDEGTAIAKAAENSSMVPTNQYFLTLDADGVAVSSDFYLRLTGDINRLFHDQIPLTTNHPTPHQ